MSQILGGGKWQRRILQTLQEARCPLTTRSLRIRCGMTHAMDPTGSSMRNAMQTLIQAGWCQRIHRGLFALVNNEERTGNGML